MITDLSLSPRGVFRRLPCRSALILSAGLLLLGCETNDPPIQRTVTGVVAVPAGDQAQFSSRESDIVSRMLAAVFGEPAQAEIAGLTPLSGALVQLVRLDESGSVIEVIASDVTDGSGAYRFDTTPIPASTLAVRVTGDTDTLRAIVTGLTVDVTPASEAVVRAIINEVITPSTGSVRLSNFDVTEVASLTQLVSSMDVDVAGLTVGEAIDQITASASPLLVRLATGFSAPGVVTTLENMSFGGVDFVPVLIEPSAAGSGDGGLELRTGSATWGFFSFNVVSGQAFGLRTRHDLEGVMPAENALDDIAGTQHILTGDGQMVVGSSADVTVVGALTADARFMVYPRAVESGDTTRGRGIRMATSRSPTVRLDNTVLDPEGEGTEYHLIRLRETLSGADGGQNFIALSAETGTLSFNSELEMLSEGSTNVLNELRSVGPIAADRLRIDLDSASVSTDNPAIDNIDAGYLVILDGSTQMFRSDGNVLGQGYTTRDGDLLVMQTSSNLFQLSLDVLANDVDADMGDMLEITGVAQGTLAGTVIVNAARNGILYMPPADFGSVTTETFTYTVSDGVDAATATVTLNITEASAPPVAGDDSYSVAFESVDNVLDVLANDTDPDLGDRLAIVDVLTDDPGLPVGSVVEIVDNRLQYTSAPGHTGAVEFQYVVEDSAGERTTASVTVTTRAAGENGAPVPGDDGFTLAVNSGETSLDVLANDVDPDLGDVLTITAFVPPVNGTVTIALESDRLLYTPNTDYEGSDSFVYTVSDGTVTADATVNVTVTAGNTAPVAADDTWNFILADNDGAGPPAAQPATNIVDREIGIAIRKAADLNDNILSGTYNLVQHAGYLSAGTDYAVGTGYDYGTLSFDGEGAIDTGVIYTRHTSLDVDAARAGLPALLETALPQTPASVAGAYDVAADGALTLNLVSGDKTITGSGAISLDGEVATIAVRIQQSGIDIGRGLLFLIRQH